MTVYSYGRYDPILVLSMLITHNSLSGWVTLAVSYRTISNQGLLAIVLFFYVLSRLSYTQTTSIAGRLIILPYSDLTFFTTKSSYHLIYTYPLVKILHCIIH